MMEKCCKRCSRYNGEAHYCYYLGEITKEDYICTRWNPDNAVNWEQRRYEIAKRALAGNIGMWQEKFRFRKSMKFDDEEFDDNPYKYAAQCAILYADALIEELKKKRNDSKD